MKLFIMDAHTRCKGRQAVKTVLGTCALRYNAGHVLPPNVISLFTSRVELEVPFRHTGIGYTRHF